MWISILINDIECKMLDWIMKKFDNNLLLKFEVNQ